MRTSSSRPSNRRPPPGIAYAGPTAVNLREDLGPRANVVATLQHGERLEVLETRRRFVRVRTAKGLEGWTDANYLLSQQQVSDLDQLAEFAAKLPSQGKGTTYDALNVHTAPSRQAPSFTQIPEGGAVEVLVHRVSPRNAVMPPAAAPVKTKGKAANEQVAAGQAGQARQRDLRLPRHPLPRRLPIGWNYRVRARRNWAAESPAAEPAKAVPADDWYLVRTRDGKAGWVLARQISMSIPDEVAQYAEGHVITGYLSLGKVGNDRQGQLAVDDDLSGFPGLGFRQFSRIRLEPQKEPVRDGLYRAQREGPVSHRGATRVGRGCIFLRGARRQGWPGLQEDLRVQRVSREAGFEGTPSGAAGGARSPHDRQL